MRKCDVLYFEDDGVARKDGFDRLFHQEQVCNQLRKQRREGNIADSLCIKEKGMSHLKYLFYLDDYEKRKQKGVTSVMKIITSTSFFETDAYQSLKHIVDDYVDLLEINFQALKTPCYLRRKRISLNSTGLKTVLMSLKQKRMEEKLEKHL